MTSSRLVRRLAAMDGDELRFRVGSVARREVARLAFAARRPSWRREALPWLLRKDDDVLGPVREHLVRGDWDAAHRLLMQQVVDGRVPFAIDPGARDAISSTILSAFPTSTTDAISRADRIVDGSFDLLGYRGLSFHSGGRAEIDWHFDPVHNLRPRRGYWSSIPFLDPDSGDHKIIWELNRHQHWLTLGRAYWLTGDARYRRAFCSQLQSWMSSNPPLDGINWASMLELGFRGISWMWALQLFALPADRVPQDEAPWTVDLLLGLDRQLSLLERNLSRYFSPNTHLLGEALALYVVGRALPGLTSAQRWEATGRTVLIEEAARQINADGGHVELSTHYHRYVLDFYLLALAIASRTGDPCAPRFASAVSSLASFARSMSDDGGRAPAVGDDDGGMFFPMCGREPSDLQDSLQLSAHLLDRPELAVGAPAEEVVWMTGSAPRLLRGSSAWPSTALERTGYFVSRTTRGDHLAVDAGPHGFLNGGHAHADALAIVLSVRGEAVLIDPGTGCYTIDPEIRDRFRSTAFHNTLTLDGRSQSVPEGPFHWRSRANARSLDWTSANGFDYFEGAHDGYAPIEHHRSILSRPGCWIVVDRIVGSGTHRTDRHWHVHPAWQVTRVGRAMVRARNDAGSTMWIVSPGDDVESSIVKGGLDGERLGWCAPVYGPLVASPTVRVSTIAEAPFARVTVIVDGAEAPDVALVPCERLVEHAGAARNGTQATAQDSEAVAIAIRTASQSEIVMFTRRRDEAAAAPKQRRLWNAGAIYTDARVLCWREDDMFDGPVLTIDGSIAERREPQTNRTTTGEVSRLPCAG